MKGLNAPSSDKPKDKLSTLKLGSLYYLLNFRISGSSVKYINKVLQWFVLHESLHGLIACQPQLVVERCSSTVTVLGSLPEQALIITQERSTLHLRLMLENRVTFCPQLLGSKEHTFRYSQSPILPRHHDTSRCDSPSTILHPLSSLRR